MSLGLIQSYSSAEDEEENPHTPSAEDYIFSDDEGETEENGTSSGIRGAETRHLSYRSVYDSSDAPNSSSGLPSALDAFSKVSAPPQFLNNSVEGNVAGRGTDFQQPRHGRWRARKEKKELPSGAVLESKPQLVGIHERVRSDIQSSQSQASSVASTTDGGGKRVAGAANPGAEDAAELLRLCSQCGIPKTFSNSTGITCPQCGDRPPNDASQEGKRKGSAVKDKEKSKRMKGQSSHATWKSETEMTLRQQFD
ncbi:unnamed protein product [Linum trigynum]|uniref:Uncharacterized protein n=1 Tax=Linum trigynum TaxID=586398 RepID=A0AAV2EVY6_9ROSI